MDTSFSSMTLSTNRQKSIIQAELYPLGCKTTEYAICTNIQTQNFNLRKQVKCGAFHLSGNDSKLSLRITNCMFNKQAYIDEKQGGPHEVLSSTLDNWYLFQANGSEKFRGGGGAPSMLTTQFIFRNELSDQVHSIHLRFKFCKTKKADTYNLLKH